MARQSPVSAGIAAAACASALVVGSILRLWNLPAQILAGDEVHAVRAALTMTLPAILTTYQPNDDCIPLSALFHLLLARGVPMRELGFRLPSLLCGLAALVAIPWAMERRLGRPVAIVLAWLVALSPLLVLYSRIVRPYLPIVLLSFGAAAAFEAWWRTGRRRLAVLYVACAGLSGFFHLATAPFVVAPLGFAAVDLLLRRLRRPPPGAAPEVPGSPGAAASEPTDRRPGWTALALVAAAVALAFLAFLVPAGSSLVRLIAEKRAPFELTRRAAWDVLELEAGSGRPLVAASFWTVALGGLAILFRRDRRFALYTAWLAAAQTAGLIALSPELLGHPLVLDRYLLPVLPWALLWAAVGLTASWPIHLRRPAWSAAGHWLPAAAVALLIAAWWLAGPLAERRFLASSFTGHNDFVAFFCPRARVAPRDVPAFYAELLRREADAPVLEFPFYPQWTYHHAYYAYEDIHRQEVLVGLAEPLPELRLDLRNSIQATPQAFLASRARYLAVHTRLLAEEARVAGHCWPLLTKMSPRHQSRLERGGPRMAAALAREWGQPDLIDGAIWVWDLARVRRHLPLPRPELVVSYPADPGGPWPRQPAGARFPGPTGERAE